jgi:hypothetical protein
MIHLIIGATLYGSAFDQALDNLARWRSRLIDPPRRRRLQCQTAFANNQTLST